MEKLIANFLSFCTRLVTPSEAKFTLGLDDKLKPVRYFTEEIGGGGTTNLAIQNRTSTTLDINPGSGQNATIPAASTTQAGLMSAADKVKVNGAALSKVDDTNVGITLTGGFANALLSAMTVTVNWIGTLADSRIASAAIWNAKNSGIQFKDEGVNLGTIGTVNEIDFVGGGGSASRTGNKLTITFNEGSAAANLDSAPSTNNVVITNSAGADATIAAATSLIAGVMTAADKVKLDGLGAQNDANIRVVATNTTIDASADGTVVFSASGTVATLPTPVNKKKVVVKNASAGSIDVTGHIDGVASSTYTMISGEAFDFHSNGTTWYML